MKHTSDMIYVTPDLLKRFIAKHSFELSFEIISNLFKNAQGYFEAVEIAENRKIAIKVMKDSFDYAFTWQAKKSIAKDIKLLKESLKYNLKEANYYKNMFMARWYTIKYLWETDSLFEACDIDILDFE